MTDAPAVIDTNVVVSGVLTSHAAAPTARILDAMLVGRFRLLMSVELLSEYREVLMRDRIRRRHGLSPAEIDVILTEIAANAEIVDVEQAGTRPRKQDAHLHRILEAVPAARLVSGDRKLASGVVDAARVLTPKEFADLLPE